MIIEIYIFDVIFDLFKNEQHLILNIFFVIKMNIRILHSNILAKASFFNFFCRLYQCSNIFGNLI